MRVKLGFNKGKVLASGVGKYEEVKNSHVILHGALAVTTIYYEYTIVISTDTDSNGGFRCCKNGFETC